MTKIILIPQRGPKGPGGGQGTAGATGATGATGSQGPAGGTLTIQEVDGSPTGSVSTLKVTNGTLTDNGGGIFTLTITSGTGDVVGPSSAVDDNLAIFDTATGKLIADSGISYNEIQSAFYRALGT